MFLSDIVKAASATQTAPRAANPISGAYGSKVKMYSTPGTFSWVADAVSARVRVFSGGANGAIAASGGGCGFSLKVCTGLIIGNSYTVVVGAVGGTSSFGGLFSATGASGTVAGAGSGGDVNYTGGTGGSSGTSGGGSAANVYGNGSSSNQSGTSGGGGVAGTQGFNGGSGIGGVGGIGAITVGSAVASPAGNGEAAITQFFPDWLGTGGGGGGAPSTGSTPGGNGSNGGGGGATGSTAGSGGAAGGWPGGGGGGGGGAYTPAGMSGCVIIES